MPAEVTAQGDRTASVAPAIRSTAPWRVQELTALPDDRLFERFLDGRTGIVDLSPLIASPNTGVFALGGPDLVRAGPRRNGGHRLARQVGSCPGAMHAPIKQYGGRRLLGSCPAARGSVQGPEGVP